MPNHTKTRPQPESIADSRPLISASLVRGLQLSSLVMLLFLAGFYTETLFAFFTSLYADLFLAFSRANVLNEGTAQVSGLITKRSFPAMLTFGLGYTLLSFLFLHVYFRDVKKSRFAAGFYGLVFLGCMVFMLTGKVIPDFTGATRLARRLIEFIVSPFPVILLIAALKAFPVKKAGKEM